MTSSEAYFLPISESWGWATWRSRWESFDRESSQRAEGKSFHFLRELVLSSGRYREMGHHQANGLIDSWAIDWLFSGQILGQVSVFPPRSLVLNLGLDSGTHPIRNQKLLKWWTREKLDLSQGPVYLPRVVRLNVLNVLRLARALSGGKWRALLSLRLIPTLKISCHSIDPRTFPKFRTQKSRREG